MFALQNNTQAKSLRLGKMKNNLLVYGIFKICPVVIGAVIAKPLAAAMEFGSTSPKAQAMV
jgi:hypothetical protein